MAPTVQYTLDVSPTVHHLPQMGTSLGSVSFIASVLQTNNISLRFRQKSDNCQTLHATRMIGKLMKKNWGIPHCRLLSEVIQKCCFFVNLLFVFPSVCPLICLSDCLSVCLSAYLSVCLPVMSSVCPPICLFACVPGSLFAWLSLCSSFFCLSAYLSLPTTCLSAPLVTEVTVFKIVT